MSVRVPVFLSVLLGVSAALLGSHCGSATAASPQVEAVSQAASVEPIQVALSPPPPPPAAAVATSGHLSIRGSDILDPSGRPILLRGWNWGHWGKAQPQDAADNASQGANVVRIPLRWWGHYERPGIDARAESAPMLLDPAHLQMLDANVQAASRAHLWIVLFIDSDCGQNGTQNPEQVQYCDPSHRYPAGHNFFTDRDERARFIALWRFIATRYKDTPYLGMFEPLPEPGGPDTPPADIAAFYAEVTNAIRQVAPGIPFLLGGHHYRAQQLETVYNPQWHDVIYTGNLFMHSGGGPKTGVGGVDERVRDLVQFRDRHRVPVFVQQVGVRTSDDDASLSSLKAVLGSLVRERIGFTYWQYRSNDYRRSYGAVVEEKDGRWTTRTPTLQAVSSFFKN